MLARFIIAVLLGSKGLAFEAVLKEKHFSLFLDVYCQQKRWIKYRNWRHTRIL